MLRNVEVHRPDEKLATNHSDFRPGINHAIDKATFKVKDARGRTVKNPNTGRIERIPNPDVKGNVEAAINVDIPEAGTKKGNKRFGESGTYGTKFGKGGGDLYQDIIDNELTNVNNQNPDPEKYLDRINIIDREGNLRATIEKSGTAQTDYSWTIKRYG